MRGIVLEPAYGLPRVTMTTLVIKHAALWAMLWHNRGLDFADSRGLALIDGGTL